jgi:hypothetical protein
MGPEQNGYVWKNDVEIPAGKSVPGSGAQPTQYPPVAVASVEAVQLLTPMIPRK